MRVYEFGFPRMSLLGDSVHRGNQPYTFSFVDCGHSRVRARARRSLYGAGSKAISFDRKASCSDHRERCCPGKLEPPPRLLLFVGTGRRTISFGYRGTIPLGYWARRNLLNSSDHLDGYRSQRKIRVLGLLTLGRNSCRRSSCRLLYARRLIFISLYCQFFTTFLAVLPR